MASTSIENSNAAFWSASLDDRHGWGFALLLAVVATLFVRPADLIERVDTWPIYQFLIVSCLVVSMRATFRQLSWRHLGIQPLTALLLALLLSVGLSHLSHGFLWGVRMSMYETGKLLIFYLLIAGLVNTPQRLIFFVRWLAMIITFVAALALLDRAGIISVAAFETIHSHGASGGESEALVERIRGTGIFQDPNDFGLVLVTGLLLSASFIFRPGAGWPRYLWLAPTITLFAALAQTHSRGAFLSIACAVPAGLVYYRGWRLGAVSLLALPLLVLLFSARMTDFHALNVGTGQSRIQIWSESLTVFRHYPLFGVGEGLLVEEIGVVAHNSFLHCYAELGFFGGTIFLSCFLITVLELWSQRTTLDERHPADAERESRPQLSHLRVFVFAALFAYGVGMLTLSRQFVMPTYLVLGLAASTGSLSCSQPTQIRIGSRHLLLASLTSVAALGSMHMVVRAFVHWQ
jgi:hypothetical protein